MDEIYDYPVQEIYVKKLKNVDAGEVISDKTLFCTFGFTGNEYTPWNSVILSFAQAKFLQKELTLMLAKLAKQQNDSG